MLHVLKQLHKQKLQVDIDKCKFSTKKVKYLGMIVTTDRIKIDPKKIKAIQRWESSVSVKKMQAFLRFVNFYHQFILSFSKVFQPLMDDTKKSQYTTKSGNKKVKYDFFKWTKAKEKAFKDLKRAFNTASVLAHYNSLLEIWVETNASDFVVAEVLS